MLLIYQNATMRVSGAWIRIQCVLCKKKAPLAVCSGPLLVHDKPLGVHVFLRLVFVFMNVIRHICVPS